jgi:hypothetical protein
MVTSGRGCHNAVMAESPEPEQQLNAVRLSAEHGFEYYDGSQWVPYREVPDDGGEPTAVVRG